MTRIVEPGDEWRSPVPEWPRADEPCSGCPEPDPNVIEPWDSWTPRSPVSSDENAGEHES